MEPAVTLLPIPEEHYANYRYEAIFRAYKWDPQVEDQNTLSRYAVQLSRETAEALEGWAESLSRETMAMEEALLHQPKLAKEMGLPRDIRRALRRSGEYDRSKHVRLMRFDFHPTTTGWSVSEVNSDVPGGLAEASLLCRLAGKLFPRCEARGHVGESLLRAFQAVAQPGPVTLVHATAYSDDRQVMQFIGDYLQQHGYPAVYAAPDHLQWNRKRAHSLVEGQEGPVQGILRFFPLEWLGDLPRRSGWKGYYDSETPSCNHPVAILTQSKRLPLVWDRLGVDCATWKALLPETRDPRKVRDRDGWILKPAFGRVGEGISIREAVTEKEYRRIVKAARRSPLDWVAQRRFESSPLPADGGGEYHLCIGVFTVNGTAAGFYGRMSPSPRIDSKAIDVPILVAKRGNGHVR